MGTVLSRVVLGRLLWTVIRPLDRSTLNYVIHDVTRRLDVMLVIPRTQKELFYVTTCSRLPMPRKLVILRALTFRCAQEGR